ncbi:hypothetical protein GQ43DRAFT_375095 [Delitschia confertaspora ATCC 74209]|uniref:Trafficking protein particle complex II-specific subunit 65 IgD3 domain-containing protein n=1 Tax=Delitschia confertaspora ATCC 74209 TaxID=1513339 RepID=A0A9P4JIB8_9PLEO|nr:hypothetical protein GQ43DRAFT_375095 [Delitschia confertaspora ATCC 74209]
MALDDTEVLPRGSAEFVESSVLEAIIPSHSSINLKDEIASWDGGAEEDNNSVLPFVSQRNFLLFVYVVLRTPLIEESTLNSYLARLAISLESFALSTASNSDSKETRASPPKELIFSETIRDSYEPSFVRRETDAEPHVYVIWKVDVFICRPHGKFHKPAIYFSPTASLRPPERKRKSLLEDEYLPSKVPAALNLLQSFENDPALAGIQPRLSALRISKVGPTASVAKELVRPIRSGQRRLFRAAPALIWRMRYSRVHSPVRDATLMASLDLEVAHITGCSISIENIQLDLQGARVQTLSEGPVASSVNKPGDQVTQLYKITPATPDDTSSLLEKDGHVLILRIRAKVLVSNDCRPNISIEWRTNVDFTVEAASSVTKTIQPAHQSAKASGSESRPSQDGHKQVQAVNITLTISGPPSVQVGDTFRWSVFVVNRSEKTRKLALLVVPKRMRDSHMEKHKTRPSSSSTTIRRDSKETLLASAVLDDNIVYAMQKSARQESAQLVCLTPDVRIGHLAAGGCYTAELQFRALSSGVLNTYVDALRIVDLATQEVADIRELPTIIARSRHIHLIELHGVSGSRRSEHIPTCTGGSICQTIGGRNPSTNTSGPILAEANPFTTSSLLEPQTLRTKPTCSTMIENQRHRLLRALNNRWIYGKIPLLHAAVFLLQMAAVSLLTRKFNSYYARRPVLTTMITNAILGGIADTVAQSLTAVRERAVRKPGGPDKDDFVAIEIHELDKKNPWPAGELIPNSPRLPPPFDFERLTRFMAYGFLMAPIQHRWFSILSRTFPVSKTAAFVPALKRVAFDQLLFAPLGLAAFFSFMTVAEGGGKRALTRKFQDVYVPALKANYMVWPAVQIINFRLMPIQFQLPFVSTVGIAWTAYLSLTNSSEEA